MDIANLFQDDGKRNLAPPMVGFYQEMFSKRSQEELRLIARTKRFLERFRGDAGWRSKLREHPQEAQRLFDAKGIELDAQSVASMWLDLRGDACDPQAKRGVHRPCKPLELWIDWSKDLAAYRDMCRDVASTSEHHPRFDAWRTRQLKRLTRELDPQNARAINSPLIAYELSSGCSVGCWFCGVSAERFGGHAAYDVETSELWSGILDAIVDRFGPAAATGFCYWGTDPSDNPDYCRFIDEHRRITGFLPPTTTAVPMRSIALTRDILALGNRYRHGNNRFSVLSLRSLDAIHQTFDADELLTVDLVLHMNGSLTPKAKAGRGLRNRARIDRLQSIDAATTDLEHGSIACVTGFLVSLPRRTVRLISPCRSDDQHPDGYITFAEKSFKDTKTFCEAIDRLTAENMQEQPHTNKALGFPPSLRTCFEGDSLVIHSLGGTERVMPFPFLRLLVDLLGEQRHGFLELVRRVAADFPDDFLSVGVVVQELFDEGLLEEFPISPQSAFVKSQISMS